MSRRTTRSLSDMDRQALLEAIAKCRAACVTASTKAPISGDVYSTAGKLMQAIDDMAQTLTGDHAYLHLKGHSTPRSGNP